MKKQIIAVFCAALLAVTSCAAPSDSDENRVSVIDRGMEVIAMLDEILDSDTYAALYNLPADYADTVDAVRDGQYRTPSAVYALDVPVAAVAGMELDVSGLSEQLRAYLQGSVLVSFASRLNVTGGTEAMAVASVYSVQKTFVCGALTEAVIYLYVFESASPIAVAFLPGDDGAVRASASLILTVGLQTDSAQAIEDSLAAVGMTGVTAEKLS